MSVAENIHKIHKFFHQDATAFNTEWLLQNQKRLTMNHYNQGGHETYGEQKSESMQ